MRIEKVNHEDPAVKARIIEFLAPHERHCLFVLGNLRRDFPDSHIYVASRGTEWVGLTGYYGGPKSMAPFAEDAEAVRGMVHRVAERHPDVRWMTGIAYAAAPAYAELLRLGFQPDNDPHQVFMELDGAPPPQPHEDSTRPVRSEDAPELALLLRYVQNVVDQRAPVTEEELSRVRMNPLRHVLVADGRIVSTASTNGIGIKAFQILGVATAPDVRRRGYASAVCASLIRAMGRESAERCVLFTGRENRPAQRCYERLGFRTTGAYYVAKFKPPGT